MKRFITLLTLMFIGYTVLAAAAPTVPSSGLSFNNVDGGSLAGSFKAGNGNFRIVVMKEGSPVIGLPVDGIDYKADDNFGGAASAFTQPGEFVVSRGGTSSFTTKNLKPGTTYHIAIFEFNGTGTATTYLVLPLEGSRSTASAPSGQASFLPATNITGNSMTLNWTRGTGAGRIVLARKGSAVNATPVDLTYYSPDDDFGVGTKIGVDNFVVYKNTGTGTSTIVKSLEPNVIYHFAVFEYNGSATPVHLTPGATFSVATTAGPTVASTGATYSYVEGNSFRINVSGGNGSRKLFIAKKGSPVTKSPVNGTTYTANAAFGTPGTTIGNAADGEFVLAATTNNYVDITNLEPNTTYHFRVFEYDVDAAGNTYYLTSSFLTRNAPTASTPAVVASDLQMKSVSGNSATFAWKNGAGTGAYRMILMKAGGPVDATPANLVRYDGNTNFGEGDMIGDGNYCLVDFMNGSQSTANKLQAGVTYHVAIFEFNGDDHPVYSTDAARISFTVPLEPTDISTNPGMTLQDGKSLRFTWNNGNGAKRIVVARKGTAVTARPTDEAIYTPGEFMLGDAIEDGQYVVFNGSATFVDVKNLEIASTYYFAVFEYNESQAGKPDYLNTSALTYSASTIGWPATQPVINNVSNVQATSAIVNFTKGNGSTRLFIMKKGAPVNVLPQDLVKYNYSASFGNATALISDGNYVVNMPGNSGQFTVTNLEPNTTYHISAFEFNGANEPAYLRTNVPTATFTTPDVPGATIPTSPAINPVVEDVDGDKLTLKWTNGDGDRRIVVMRAGAAVNFVPVAGTSYNAGAAFGSSPNLGDGQYVVYNNTGSSVDITDLDPSTTYHFKVFEFDGTGTLIRYLTSSVLAGTAVTATPPATPVTDVQATPGATSITIGWSGGSGSGRLVVMREGNAVSSTPAPLSAYPANPEFKKGSQIAAGEFAVYAGAGNSVTVIGLQANKTYHYSIFEYNGIAAPVYNTLNIVTGSATISSTLPISLLYFRARENNGQVSLTWATAQEVNNASFTVERSKDGTHFEAIKTMPGAGNSNHVIEYSYTDATAGTGKAWYRLKQTDLDGRSTHSLVATIDPQTTGKGINIYPNPVQARFKVEWPGNDKEAVLLAFDARGVLVKQQKITAGQYVNSADWKAGTYYLTVHAAGKQYSSVLIKQ